MSEAWLLSCKLFVRVAISISFLEGKFPDFFNLLQDYYAAEMTVSTTRLLVRSKSTKTSYVFLFCSQVSPRFLPQQPTLRTT